jgi:signal transduction histidine kinase
VWVSGGQSGVKRIDEPQAAHPKFITYTVAEGLSSNQVNCITEDQWGRLYFGTGRGLDRLDPNTGRIKHYTVADGLVKGRVRYALRDRNGALWFANETGLSRLIPEPDRPQPEPQILIDGLQIAGVPHSLSELGESQVGPLELSSGQNQVSIDFVGLEFGPGEVLRYQHKLDGADRDWSGPSDQRLINYENLAPGSYRFEVRAITDEGVVSLRPAIVAFTIPPPFWRRWWFITMGVALMGLLIYTAHHYRVARLLELERVRTRIATDLHDDIGSSLSRMAILSEVAKRRMEDTSRDSIPILSDIADAARSAVDSMSDIVWAIDPRRDDLNNVVFRVRQFASDLLGAKGIAWEFQAPPDFEKVKLNPEQRRHLFLIFKEAINNSVRHARCQSVYLSLNVVHSRIVGEIRDNGCGFVLSPDQTSETDGRGHGLANLRTRAAQLGGDLHIDASPGKGTCVTFSAPLKRGMA